MNFSPGLILPHRATPYSWSLLILPLSSSVFVDSPASFAVRCLLKELVRFVSRTLLDTTHLFVANACVHRALCASVQCVHSARGQNIFASFPSPARTVVRIVFAYFADLRICTFVVMKARHCISPQFAHQTARRTVIIPYKFLMLTR